jgi:hypothetical protein
LCVEAAASEFMVGRCFMRRRAVAYMAWVIVLCRLCGEAVGSVDAVLGETA